MCRCRPEVRTPFCGRPGCEWPPQKEALTVTRCSSCREIRETVRFHDPQHGFARVCEKCWQAAGREKGWIASGLPENGGEEALVKLRRKPGWPMTLDVVTE